MSDKDPNPQLTIDERMLRNATWGASLMTVAGLIFVVVGFTIAEINSWKDYVLLGAPAMLFVLGLIGLIFLRKKRIVIGTGIIFIANLVMPVILSIFQTDVGWAIFLYTVMSSGLLILRTLPQKSRRWAMIVTVVALVVIAAVEVADPAFRISPADELLVVIIAATSIITLAFMLQAGLDLWSSGRIRDRIIVLMLIVLLPVLIVSGWYNVRSQRQEIEIMLLQKAEAIAVSGAATIGYLFEDAIVSGILTTDDVFDTDYVKFWEFDPESYEFDGDPSSLDKYHTAYDAYTDVYWQELVEAYLVDQDDLIYTIPVDINGYLPTHNLRWSAWDGSPARDRSKRIFDDPVGIKAARNTEPVLQQIYPRPGTGETLWDVSAPIYVNGEHWGAFRVGMELTENLERVQNATVRSVATTAGVIALVFGFAWFFGGYLSDPLERLSEAAVRASSGDLSGTIDIPNRGEITTLANSFSSMMSQLRVLLDELEQRVADRTRALETSTEVSRRLSTILEQGLLVRDVVEQLQTAFGYYHAHIYLYDENKEYLEMVGGTGEAGRTMLAQGHKLQKGQGLVGRAAESNQIIIIPDVSVEQGWLPNPLLPDTKAELSVPISAGQEVIGVLDVQHNITDGLTEQDAALVHSIANQVAIALQNAQAYTRAQQDAEREALIASIGQQIQSAINVEEALQIAISQLGQALGAELSQVELRVTD